MRDSPFIGMKSTVIKLTLSNADAKKLRAMATAQKRTVSLLVSFFIEQADTWMMDSAAHKESDRLAKAGGRPK